ncbi:hypothetical protein GH741_15510 [Aquibacillus halophilus]|uniref:Uncharacterized protein n=1 Tax=Aquibacillus halophilus TaxID=930132 RepID=A0A6A8DFN4_9BACI|nr:hypothetical protein [Aquibacillus halophilus]MRH44050.1 hypothetical protein [Aquibacillus halophilus]
MNWNAGIKAGAISVLFAVLFTYLASLLFETEDLYWAIIAVTFASFFSGFFSAQKQP